MGIAVEYNPDLALRNYREHEIGNRKKDECLPRDLKAEEICGFLKKGQRNYWLYGEIPLLETKGNQILSRPKASILILEATHFISQGEVYTKGKYKVIKVFNDDKIYFEGFERVK